MNSMTWRPSYVSRSSFSGDKALFAEWAETGARSETNAAG